MASSPSVSASPPSKIIDDKRVQGIIDYAVYLAHISEPKVTPEGEAALAFQRLIRLRRWNVAKQGPLTNIEYYSNWKDLLQLPENPLDLNLNLMAAEHYAFALKVAIELGDPHTEGIVRTYFAAKTLLFHVPMGMGERLLRTDPDHPVLPESDASKRWAAAGVFKGLEEYRRRHNGKLGLPFSAKGLLTDNAPTQYKQARGNLPAAYSKTSYEP
jgi:hypothetical protein